MARSGANRGGGGSARKRIALLALAASACASPGSSGESFDSPELAVQAMADAVGSGDPRAVEEILGESGAKLVRSGDPVADRRDAVRFRQAVAERVELEQVGAREAIAWVGDDPWPVPFPLVREHGGWRFDVEAGAEELENRRIGRNELSTIATLHEYVDAQREFAALPRDGPPEFAGRLLSTPGRHDGLYWPTEAGEPNSPLGAFVAEAGQEGYAFGGNRPVPYHGYCYRSLDGQGPHAPGGALDFVDADGRRTRGFALIAWPAKHGSSGVMTFLVGRNGVVYQKDLGPRTEEAAARILVFDPDPSWTPARE
jgi:hypothetical protein